MGIVDLNVGGTIFTVGMATLLSDPQSLFHSIYSTLPSTLVRGGGKTGGAGKQVSPPSSTHLPAGMEFDDSGRVFFDRSPENFPQILTYLRDETLPREECALHVYHEAKFYRVQGLMDWCSRQAGVVGMLINRLVHESMEEECEQFKQAILQASHHHISESLKVNFTDSRASIVCYDLPATTTAMPTALPMTTSGAMSSSSTTTPTTTRSLQTTLLLVVSQHQQGNICPKRPNAVPVPPPILTPVDGNAPAPPRFQSARFVVGDPQLSSHRFISNAASLTSARHRIDIALPFMLGKRLDLLYTFVARHFSAADMRLTLRQGSTSGPPLSLQVSAAPSPTVISNQPISGVQSSGTSAREIPCFECGQPFSLYEMVVTWWTA
ncbi:uncharacterized protein LOC135821365 [Sycon ciliatum]|uniref:uncharacterized protein LOC135821365 n=1 Tax=Sycon ciliatum TaxID=27933 RepID=UPI0031F6C634